MDIAEDGREPAMTWTLGSGIIERLGGRGGWPEGVSDRIGEKARCIYVEALPRSKVMSD